MANEEQVKLLQQGVDVWNEWRLENAHLIDAPYKDPDVPVSDLIELDFTSANLMNLNLEGAILSYSNFSFANLSGANLRLADLSPAIFIGANFTSANLSESNLRDVDFSNANLKYTNLQNANCSYATFDSTAFLQTNLSNIIGLENSHHRGPSSIDNHTLQNSEILPEVFLKNIGLANWEIEQTKLYQKDLDPNLASDILYKVHELRFDSPIQAHNLFISYAHKDYEFVDQLAQTLDKKGIRFWRDIKNLSDAPAGPLDDVLKMEMQGKVVLLVLSENSISSPWVNYEMETAADIEVRENRNTLLPIALDDTWLSRKWSSKIKNRIFDKNVPDFSQWRDEIIYNQRFRQVLEGLDLFYKNDE